MKVDFHWQVCKHEAAHIVGALVTGGSVTAAFARSDGGLAECQPPNATSAAILTACGPVADELLADELPPPRQAKQQPTGDPVPKFNGVPTAELLTACGDDGSSSDDRMLAQWAIGGIEDHPRRWSERIEWAKYEAAKIIHSNRPAILRLARALYEKHFLYGSEVEKIFNEEKENESERTQNA